MTENQAHIENRIKTLRIITTISTLISPLFLLLVAISPFFWALFCVTLFPLSIISLTIHFFLGKIRRNKKLNVNEWDNVKIFIGITGLIVGIILWGVAYVLTY